jgi:alginate O-acetyltransferase complex protein AlgI
LTDAVQLLPLHFFLHADIPGGHRHVARQSDFDVARVHELLFYAFNGHVWFLAPLLFTTLLDYVLALKMHRSASDRIRGWILAASVAANLLLLFYFKYALFFATSFYGVLPSWLESALRVALPAGISFYTFQSISYMADVYQERAEPETNFWEYAAFISFFPHLLAGPITRHNQLIPQLKDLAKNGARLRWENGLLLFSIGLIKKVVIADPIARMIDPMIAGIDTAGAARAWLAIFGYAMQLYFDFSAYSDMAIGLGRIIGIELPQNFNSPFRSLNPSEFWTRWHISLSRWIQDYLFEPLSYSLLRRGWRFEIAIFASLVISMGLAGLWHGANWTFVAFGLYHGALLLIYHTNKDGWNALPEALQRTLTFLLFCGGWVFFRAGNFHQALEWFAGLAGRNGLKPAELTSADMFLALTVLGCYSACVTLPNASNHQNLSALPGTFKMAVGSLTAVSFLLFSLSSKFLYFNF